MRNKEEDVKKRKFPYWVILLVIFLIFIFWPRSQSVNEEETIFTFSNSDTGEILNGELIFDNQSYGFTEKGNISIPRLERAPSNMKFKGYYKGKQFEIEYLFPQDYYLYEIFPFSASEKNLEDYIKYYSYQKSGEMDNFSNNSKFHWGHMPLTFKFENNSCLESHINRTRLAFEKIDFETDHLVFFEEVNETPDISIYCKSSYHDKNEQSWLGDSSYQPKNINSNLIIHGIINFYGQGQICITGYPDVEVHEILHLLDIGHNPIIGSIMHPYSADSSNDCKITKIDKEYTSCLKYIYSNGAFPGNCSFSNYIHEENSYEASCQDGWYEVVGTKYCCPEPNMIINEKGYCESEGILESPPFYPQNQ